MGGAHDGLGYRLATSSGKVFAFDAVEPPRPTGRRIPTSARPLDVMITGDSLAVSLQDGLDTGLRATGRARAIRRGRWCYGLSASWAPSPRNPFCPAIPIYAPHMLSDDITEFDPDAVVLMLGAWDWQGRTVGSRVLSPPTGAWWTWYESLADDAFRRLSRRRAITFWVGYPACGDGANVELERALNGAARRAAWRNPTRAVYLDLHADVCPNGRIRHLDPLPDGRRVVLLDATGHFTETGAEYTGRWIAEELGGSFRLPAPR